LHRLRDLRCFLQLLPPYSTLPAGVGSHHRSIHRQILSLDQTSCQTPPHDLLEHFQKHSRLTKASVSILGKGRVIRNLLLEIQPREPAVGQMHPYFFQQTPFARNPVEIAH